MYHRARLSNIWAPTGGIAATEKEDAQAKLIRAGFLRQSHAGIFHMLPMGRRVQDKIERLIDKHMEGLGASKLSLSTISSAALWEKSGRLANISSELFQFQDRKDVGYLLSPTHEEEITTLVAQTVKSYKSLPLRLYQITRKYRDEARPRHGLFRSREFTMKDLYTFDYTVAAALETYEQVRAAYDRLFAEMKLPVLVAKASSGDMGGDLSHEYHLSTSFGEDNVVSCDSCDYVVNDELAETLIPEGQKASEELHVWRGISKDRRVLVNVWYPSSLGDRVFSNADINVTAVKAVVPELDTSIENSLPFWQAALKSDQAAAQPSSEGLHPRLVNVVDCRVPDSLKQQIGTADSTLPLWPEGIDLELTKAVPSLTPSDDPNTPRKPLNLLRVADGDKCPHCDSGSLKVQKALELGHTFYLGTRYSAPLGAQVRVPAEVLDPASAPSTGESALVLMQMGCHGIGVSRIIGAVADHLADPAGLNWPRAIAPYEAVVIARGDEPGAAEVYDALAAGGGGAVIDAVLDDRPGMALPWKMKDADLTGYPVMVVLGREWAASRRCEVQCRRLGVREHVPFENLRERVEELLKEL
ncbi:Proline--tRNA ligase [Pleurostoma richardsiae]|uniref:proline--tRNA ligase n=1 Tax=Pleurostoma richardsiae TaxID=41990 RepID=A0AA38S2M1_9PEZI|nr:Proline--tRNA ligase [Pleurostoma richardsiae]